MTSIKPHSWEIWLANVKFEDDPETTKARPVLVIDSNRVCILSLKITSKPPRNNYYGEYQLLKWKAAGLVKPSTVRISKKLKLFERDFIRKIGRAAAIDIIKIRGFLDNEST